MNILSISDKPGSAIARLVDMTAKRLPQFRITHISVHPKRPSPDELAQVRAAAASADIIDFAYWKSGMTLLKTMPEVFTGKPLILQHQNEHNIHDDKRNHWEWADRQWDAIVAKNGWQYQQLLGRGFKPVLIRHAVEFDNFQFVPQLTKERVVGFVGQIKKVKGVRELKAACDLLGYRLIVVGKPSEAEYWTELDKNNVEFCMDVPDGELGSIYHRMRVFVCNSDDGTESGTLPILEAMASGIPVLTRNIGHVRDFGKDGRNLALHTGKYTDVEGLARRLQAVMESDETCDALREEGWRTARQYHPDLAAREFDRLFRRIANPGLVPVSIIMPTFNRPDVLRQNMEALAAQTHRNIELIVCDDGSTDDITALVEEARAKYWYPIKYVQTGYYPVGGAKRYGLSRARNLGIIEATGDILVFCDDRQRMHPGAVAAFVQQLEENPNKRIWAYGSKGAYKGFVENFSAVRRELVIEGGMFSEIVDEYGTMTQEISARFGRQKVGFVWTPTAVAEGIIGTHSKSRNRAAIIRSKVKLMKLGLT